MKHDSVFLHHHVYFYFCYPSFPSTHHQMPLLLHPTNVSTNLEHRYFFTKHFMINSFSKGIILLLICIFLATFLILFYMYLPSRVYLSCYFSYSLLHVSAVTSLSFLLLFLFSSTCICRHESIFLATFLILFYMYLPSRVYLSCYFSYSLLHVSAVTSLSFLLLFLFSSTCICRHESIFLATFLILFYMYLPSRVYLSCYFSYSLLHVSAVTSLSFLLLFLFSSTCICHHESIFLATFLLLFYMYLPSRVYLSCYFSYSLLHVSAITSLSFLLLFLFSSTCICRHEYLSCYFSYSLLHVSAVTSLF